MCGRLLRDPCALYAALLLLHIGQEVSVTTQATRHVAQIHTTYLQRGLLCKLQLLARVPAGQGAQDDFVLACQLLRVGQGPW